MFERFKCWWTQRTLNKLVGLDIGSVSLKLLEINSAVTPARVENFWMMSLPSGVMTKDDLKNMINQSGITTKQIAFAIPRSLAIIKNIMIDSRLTAEEIESRAWIEANRHFPDLIGNIYLDFCSVGPSAQDPSQLEFILAACRKEHIAPYLEVLQQGSLIAKTVDINSYALNRALAVVAQQSSHIQTISLLNLDFALSTVIVAHEHNLIYAHDSSYDGVRLMAQVKEYINNKKEIGIDDEAYINLLKENLSAHLRHIIHFFYSSRPNITIQQMVLSGDCATIPHLCYFVQQEIGIETVLANPFVNMTFAPHVNQDELKTHAPALMLCCGLALTKGFQINLLPWREQARKEKQILFGAKIGICVSLSALVIFFIHLYFNVLIDSQQQRNAYLQSAINHEQLELGKLNKIKQEQVAIDSELHFVISLRENSFRVIQLLNELVKIVPGAVSLSKVVRQGDVITLLGKSQSNLQVTLFMKNFEKSSVFDQPILTEISTTQDNKGEEGGFQLIVKQKR